MYNPGRLGGDERRCPERVCQEEIVESERGAAMEVGTGMFQYSAQYSL